MADFDTRGNKMYDHDIFGNEIDYKAKYDEAAADRHLYMSKLSALERAVITAARERADMDVDQGQGMTVEEALKLLAAK